MGSYHPRSAWQTADNGIYSAPPPRGTRTSWIVHDPGSNVAVPTAFAGQVQYIRNMNSYYQSSRGYDLGYSFICFPDGACFEVRGVDHNNAANAGKKYPDNVNNWSCSMMLANPIGTAPTDAQIETACLVMGEFGLSWGVMRHSQVDYTACPSTVDDAVFARLVPRTAPTPPPSKDEDMTMIDQYRSADTRVWPKAKLQAGMVYEFSIGEGVPPSASAAIATVTVTEPVQAGHVAIAKPGSSTLGKTSYLNFAGGQTVANTTFIPLVNGKYDIRITCDSHVVVDVLGYVG